jgi:hypothetical protein
MDFERLTCKEICNIFKVRENWIRDLEKLGLKSVEQKPIKRFNFLNLIEFIKTKEVEKQTKSRINKAIKDKADDLLKLNKKYEKALDLIDELQANKEEEGELKNKRKKSEADLKLVESKIAREHVMMLEKQTKLIKEFSLLCDKDKMEEHIIEILTTLKDSLLATAHHISFRLENKAQKDIKNDLLKEFEVILLDLQSIQIQTDTSNQKTIDQLIEDLNKEPETEENPDEE